MHRALAQCSSTCWFAPPPQDPFTGQGKQWGGRRWRSPGFSACLALPASTLTPACSSRQAPGSCVHHLSLVGFLWHGESWGTYPGYVMSHSTEVSLQESAITQHSGWHHGCLVPPGSTLDAGPKATWKLTGRACHGANLVGPPAQSSWPRGSCPHLGGG